MDTSLIVRAQPIVTLDEAKRHLRVSHDDEDLEIDAMILAAQQYIDAPKGWLGCAIGLQTLELTLDWCDLRNGGYIELPFPPLVDIVSFKYTDTSGAEQTLSLGSIAITKHLGKARLFPAYGLSWPVTRQSPDAVRIRYRAGYEHPETDALPAKQAILLLISHFYENREPIATGQAVEMPMTVTALLSQYRNWAF